MKLELRLFAAGFLLLILIVASCHQQAAAGEALPTHPCETAR
jgi:hypothetical protein